MSLGLTRIKNYLRKGALGTALVQTLLLGRSPKARDIIRMSGELKVHRRLEKKYGPLMGSVQAQSAGEINRTVWVCWLQGMENAPALVKKCHESVKKYFDGWNIVVITAENLEKYARLPEYILEKWKKGIISPVHLSDILRIDLLSRLGGLWLDATVLCTGTLPQSIEESELFLYQIMRPVSGGRSIRVASWMIWARAGSRILLETRNLLLKYWEKANSIYDYFLLHHFLSMALDRFPDDARKIFPICVSTPHTLQMNMFESYDERIWRELCTRTNFHKLTYKFDPAKAEKSGTYFDVLLK